MMSNRDPEHKNAPIVTPIYHSSVYKIESLDHFEEIIKNGGYYYSRLANPTCEDAERELTEMEGGAGSLVFSSGMSAISTALLAYLEPGDHMVACKELYSGTHSFLVTFLAKHNISVSWTSVYSPVSEYLKLIQPNTKVLYGETPCNPLISLLDLAEFGELGLSLGGRVVTMVDSTYASPYLQQPHQYGVDLVLHSGTKYIGGHSDVLAGVVSARTEDQWKKLYSLRSLLGCVLSPHEASLLSRGIKTLPIRMERISQTAEKVSNFLAKHPKVRLVHYPGQPAHPQHEVAKTQLKMFGGMMAFELNGGTEEAKRLVEGVRTIHLAVSLGGTESLIEIPAVMTHGPHIMSDDERQQAGISDGLIRLSVGLEDPDELIEDLQCALNNIA